MALHPAVAARISSARWIPLLTANVPTAKARPISRWLFPLNGRVVRLALSSGRAGSFVKKHTDGDDVSQVSPS